MQRSALFKQGLLWILLPSFFLFSCKKDIKDISSLSTGSHKAGDGIPAYFFHWESADLMPLPPGAPTIYVPWGNGSIKGFTSDIWYDMQPSDGWQMVYNEFNPNQPLPSNPIFVLYNPFKALLRIYVYVTTNGFQNSDYLTTGLTISPNTKSSPMLNYIGQDVVDINTKNTVITKIEASQIATGTWYAAQYEIAYDPAVSTDSYSDIGLNWTLKWTNISQDSLGGSIQGTLKGTISTPASGFNLGGAAQQATIGGLESLGLAVFQNNSGPNSSHPGTGNTLGLPANVFEAAENGLTSGVSGVVKNIFSGIFGSGGSSQDVNLTLNAAINLTGNSTQNGAVIPDPGLGLGVPGTSNSQSAPGIVPYYNLPMGIFYLSARPKIDVTDQLATYGVSIGYGATSRVDKHSYTIDNGSFQTLFNNAVINSSATGAHIEGFKEELVLYPPSGASLWLLGGTAVN